MTEVYCDCHSCKFWIEMKNSSWNGSCSKDDVQLIYNDGSFECNDFIMR